jgi:hypothetical protein
LKIGDKIIKMYKKYYIERDYEQVDLFRLLKDNFEISRVIYPGSYVHISPSFIFQDVVYIDSDKKAKEFFKSSSYKEYILQRKEYREDPAVNFYSIDYKKEIPELINQFDLLISQYAGFISDTCKKYLKVGGILLGNNSHGDAGLASIDDDYQLIATVHKSKGKYRISHTSLKNYFIPKRNIKVTKEYLYKTGKGVGYTKTAPLYLFRRIS